MPYRGKLALLPVLGACFLIMAGSGAIVNRLLLSNKVVVWFGLISYPLYLWHWPLLTFARIMENGIPDFSIRLGLLLLSVLLANITYRTIEIPIRFGRQKNLKTAISAGAMIIVCLIAVVISKHQGYPTRFPFTKEQQAIFAWSNSRGFDQACRKQFPLQDQCLQTSIGNPIDAVLIGDSHAHHYYYGLNESFKALKKNLVVMGAGGCLPFYDIETGAIGNVDYCKNKIEAGLNYAIQTPSVKTVFLASRGPMYITGKGFGPMENENRYLRLTTKPEIKDYALIFEISMRDTLTRLFKAHKQVVFMVDVPELNFDPQTCILPDHFPRKKAIGCNIQWDVVQKRNQQYWNIIQSVAKDFPQMFLFHTTDYLCAANKCHAMLDNKVLYRNYGHLSDDGSLYIAEKFKAEAQKKDFNF